MPAPEIIGRLGVHASRPDRWALISPAGVVMNWLDRATRPHTEIVVDLAPALACAGLVLRDDDTIVRAADLHPIAEVDQT